jgi:hypothetical protein
MTGDSKIPMEVDRFDTRAVGRSRQGGAVAGYQLSVVLMLGSLSGCASSTPPTGGTLTSYSGLTKTTAHRAQALERADNIALMAAQTVRIEPVTFASDAQSKATPVQLALLANAMERSLCKRLSTRFNIVAAPDKADLTIKTVVTRIKPTNAAAAGLSLAVSASILPFAPRIPVGLGGFSAEAEAIQPDGGQAAAMVWSRDADILSGKRVSTIGDAYDLSISFTHDLAKLLASPMTQPRIRTPTRRDKPVAVACNIYGKGPGIVGAVGGLLGASPKMTDGERTRPIAPQ